MAHCTLGLLDYGQHRFASALEKLEKGLSTRPDIVAAFNYAGMCAERLDDLTKAAHLYDTALRLVPNHEHVHFNRALLWLSLGQFERGWSEYEWRWLTGQVAKPAIPRARWDGTNLKGKRLLVHTEQGIGDTLQFVRFLPLLKEQGAHITFACLKQMRALLTRSEGIDDWLPIDEPAAITFEIYTPIGSIPGWLGINEATIPRKIPYVIPDPRHLSLRPVISSMQGFKVGICWQGSKTFIGDNFRSIPLRHYARLGQVPGVEVVSLQKGYGEEQIQQNQDRLTVRVLENLDAEGAR